MRFQVLPLNIESGNGEENSLSWKAWRQRLCPEQGTENPDGETAWETGQSNGKRATLEAKVLIYHKIILCCYHISRTNKQLPQKTKTKNQLESEAQETDNLGWGSQTP